MADLDNLTVINENFDTIKTLLNSIRAQGILNTSDVDRLLSGINTKLEKINTNEDVDLIKLFLTELKQNLDERHSVLVSKFAAIESLFTNLLKNTNELPKSTDLKELFDVVATNLTVFSREVVSQKDSLTDIMLKIDAFRSDDSNKKEIIKNITLLKPDLERISNGFDTIVLSLNDNFKTIVKSISALDNSELIEKLSDTVNDMKLSSNTVLSAIDVLDKKTETIDKSLKNLVTRDDLYHTESSIGEIRALNKDINTSLNDLTSKYYRIDNLADKIDASVNIIAGLKASLAEVGNENTVKLSEKLDNLLSETNKISNDTQFEDFKSSLHTFFAELNNDIQETKVIADNTKANVLNIVASMQALNLSQEFQNTLTIINNAEAQIKYHIEETVQQASDYNQTQIERIIDNIVTGAESLNQAFNKSKNEVTELCHNRFETVFDNISELKKMLTQADENSVASGNAMFSNITDRLNLFENTLRESLKTQEITTSEANSDLNTGIENIKNISSVIDYKIDSSIVEISNSQKKFDELRQSVDEVLALNFVDTVKDLRADLYASKQDLISVFEDTSNNISDVLTNDLYGKYELIISKIESVEDELVLLQKNNLEEIKDILSNIYSSSVDIISYVSEMKSPSTDIFDRKLEVLSENLKENNLEHIENVRAIVEVIKNQVQTNLERQEELYFEKINLLEDRILSTTSEIKVDIQGTYDRLNQLKDSYKELKESLDYNAISNTNKYDELLALSATLNSDIENKLSALKLSLLEKLSEFKQEFNCENVDKINEFKFVVDSITSKGFDATSELLLSLQNSLNEFSSLNSNERLGAIETIKNEFATLKAIVDTQSKVNVDNKNEALEKTTALFNNLEKDLLMLSDSVEANKFILTDKLENSLSLLKDAFIANSDNNNKSSMDKLVTLQDSISALKIQVSTTGEEASKFASDNLNSILKAVSELREVFISNSNENLKSIIEKVESYKENFDIIQNILDKVDENIDGDMTRQLSIIESNFEVLMSQITILNEKFEHSLADKINLEYKNISDKIQSGISDSLESYKLKIEAVFDELTEKNDYNNTNINRRLEEFNRDIREFWNIQINSQYQSLESMLSELKDLQNNGQNYTENELADFNNKLEGLKTELTLNNSNMVADFIEKLNSIEQGIKQDLEKMGSDTQNSDTELKDGLEYNFSKLSEDVKIFSDDINLEIKNIASAVGNLEKVISDNSNNNDENDALKADIEEIKTTVNYSFDKITDNQNMLEEQLVLTKNSVESLNGLLNSVQENKDTLATFSEIINTNNIALSVLTDAVNATSDGLFSEIKNNSEAVTESITDKILEIAEQFEITKEAILQSRDFVKEFVSIELEKSAKTVEAETDAIISELTEQFSVLKQSQYDETVKLTNAIESLVADQIYNNIEDLKSYLDVKTDNTIIREKLDYLKSDLTASFENLITNLNKMLPADIFNNAFSDYRLANEILINTSVDNMNDKIKGFLAEHSGYIAEVYESGYKNLENRLALFDKKFIEALGSKYEEIKLLSNTYNASIEKINLSVGDILADFKSAKDIIHGEINNLSELIKSVSSSTNDEIQKLTVCFDDLRSQISSKSFDEAFQASINKQVASLENLVREQLTYIEDINELCAISLPDVSDINVLIKSSIIDSLKDLSAKIDKQNESISIEKELNTVKTDIITKILDIFNQVSFVAEQEEIIDFIQEKHDELISVLSHIVTANDAVIDMQANINAVDDKIDNIKSEISNINDKITNIISSDGDVDYIYSLQDLESDIANLRLALQDIQNNDYNQEFNDLLNSTESIYTLVESIKKELPEKNSLDGIAEDLVSISTRTNKLILASDESYKTLQDNLQDFKLVINDLDERTKNFAQESGMDKINTKLNALNTMMTNGVKTNKVFNQVFEYLADWVDKAGIQINSISDKIETLDEIGQIKSMLLDLKAEAEDNSENVELIEALSNIFDKQAKKINSLETKLDKIIVETTVMNKNNKVDFSPLEDTMNSFLVALEEKISSQQDKINSLEEKLTNVMDLLDEKDTAQLTKKVGGMDRQIAKLNKSIEKIASHVVEK